ncbi:hypothetical protein FDECE_13139 [Fusarium decemcellulare]|nr:hypothetical protein FDECE_13139 [Fusarium decemcellulare]
MHLCGLQNEGSIRLLPVKGSGRKTLILSDRVLENPSYWPVEEPDLSGKKIAVIGTGSTGVQLVQDLTQVEYADSNESIPEKRYTEVFGDRHESFGGFDFNFLPRSTFEDSAEKRMETSEALWFHGDFHFWLANYQDMLFREPANGEAYSFWKSKVRSCVNDPNLRELLAPEKQPCSFGCKRISLEDGYYEIFNLR